MMSGYFLTIVLLSFCAQRTQGRMIRVGGYSSSSSMAQGGGGNMANFFSSLSNRGASSSSVSARNWGNGNPLQFTVSSGNRGSSGTVKWSLGFAMCRRREPTVDDLRRALSLEGCEGEKKNDCDAAEQKAMECVETFQSKPFLKRILACNEFVLREFASVQIAKVRKYFWNEESSGGLKGNRVDSLLLHLIPVDLREEVSESGIRFPVNTGTDEEKQVAVKILQKVCGDDTSSVWENVLSRLDEETMRGIFTSMFIPGYTDPEEGPDYDGKEELKKKRELLTASKLSGGGDRVKNVKTFSKLLKTSSSVMMNACIDEDIDPWGREEREVYKELRGYAKALSQDENFCDNEYMPWKPYEAANEEPVILANSFGQRPVVGSMNVGAPTEFGGFGMSSAPSEFGGVARYGAPTEFGGGARYGAPSGGIGSPSGAPMF